VPSLPPVPLSYMPACLVEWQRQLRVLQEGRRQPVGAAPAVIFFRMAQYNADVHNTHAHSPLWIHVRKPYPYEHLWRTEHRQIWRFPKSPMAPRRRRERRLPLNA
jgi:hypothetical protein